MAHQEIYCHGALLTAVQTAEPKIFEDSKTFVDMTLKMDPKIINQRFEALKREGNLTTEKLKQFLDENFLPPGHELEIWQPDDWVDRPELVERIKDGRYKEFALDLNALWKILGRKMVDDVFENPERHSLIPVPHPFIVPGDRFREFYYWDTLWILKGLLLSDMKNTAKNMILNFLHIINKHGFVPNGGRVYYLNRSQPPLLTQMVYEYYKATKDEDFIRDNMNILEKEYQFWKTNRSIHVKKGGKIYQLNHYNVSLTSPRPEGYAEDLHITEHMTTEEAERAYGDLASAAESGWDFSTRWLHWHGKHSDKLASIRTSQIIPVDLNTFLLWNEQLLAKFASITGEEGKSEAYEDLARERREALEAIMWNEEDGCWYDYDLQARQHRRRFFPSNVFPLASYGESFPDQEHKAQRVVKYLQGTGVLSYPGGIPTSMVTSGEQWDFPNAWSPLVSLMVKALDESGSVKAQQVALQISQDWVASNYEAFTKHSHMYEKYDVREKGAVGRGGEYKVQVGFGWSNGVILELLDRYGDVLTPGGDTWRLLGTEL